MKDTEFSHFQSFVSLAALAHSCEMMENSWLRWVLPIFDGL